MRKNKKRKLASEHGNKNEQKRSEKNASWKRKMRKAMKTCDGLAHIKSVLSEEESSNAANLANKVQLQSILKNKSE